MFDLLTEETLNSVITHCVHFISANGGHRLNETDHCVIAMSVKPVVISRFELLEHTWAVQDRLL